jgi:hypothetical protein
MKISPIHENCPTLISTSNCHFLKSIFVRDVDLKLSEWDVSPTMKIHEMG